jgi:methionine synthase II (cobalamin-independent)
MGHVATGIGSMPGTDYADSMQTVLGEVGDLPHLVELPERGPAASMIGRTLAVVTELGADLQPAGWRLTTATGRDQRSARSLLSADLDVAEELAQRHSGRFKVQLTGPCTLASTVELPRGDKVLADPGARRDLTEALVEGAREHVEAVRRRLPAAQVVVQLDEPALPAALAGAVPTASGFHRHRALPPAEAAGSIDAVLSAVIAAGATTAVHCCADDLPFALLAQTAAQAVSFDVSLLGSGAYDHAAAWVDDGRQLWLGVVPPGETTGTLTDADVTRAVLGLWSRLGHTEVETLPSATVTPTCGLAQVSRAQAREALTLCARAAENVSAEQGRIDP